MDKSIHKQRERIYEFTLLKFCSHVIEDLSKKTKKKYQFYTYTIVQIQKSNITNSNQFVQKFVEFIIDTITCMIP